MNDFDSVETGDGLWSEDSFFKQSVKRVRFLPNDHCPECKLSLPGPASVYIHFLFVHIVREKKKFKKEFFDPWRPRVDARLRIRYEKLVKELGVGDEKPVYVQKGDAYFCLVEGCTQADQPFGRKQAIAIHVTRIHPLSLDGGPRILKKESAPAKVEDVNQLPFSADEQSLTKRQIEILQKQFEKIDYEISQKEQEINQKKSQKLRLVNLIKALKSTL